ncbi:hypothetical protein ACFC6L_29035 [Kitasatospora phosalacinea]|uniref:hypothetical protein n=1 Tax=Kitasatospora phosalacinea TaxID=2065 RepID=UPI0035D839E5
MIPHTTPDAVRWYDDLTVNGVPYPTRHPVPPRFRTGTANARALFTADGLSEAQYTEMVAAHELGHALVWLAGGLHVPGLSTHADGQFGGHTTVKATGAPDECRTQVLGVVAGELAQDRWLRESGLWSEDRAALVETTAVRDRWIALDRITPRPHFGGSGPGSDYTLIQAMAAQHLEHIWPLMATALPLLLRERVLTGRELADHLGLPFAPPLRSGPAAA